MSDYHEIAQGLERRRNELDRVVEMGGGLYRCDYFVQMPKPGEATAQITFGVRFTNKPIMTYGFEMPPNQTLLPGTYPNGNVIVFQWASGRRPDGMRFYDGATVAIVCSGASNLSSIAHISFCGPAIRNPAGQ